MGLYYKLDGRTPVAVDDPRDYLHQRILQTTFHDGVRVSTVFMGIGGSPPLLFETMIFDGKHDQYQERHATWEEAVIAHIRAVSIVAG